MTTQHLLEGLLNGNRLSLARAISRVEDEAVDAAEILQVVFPHTGKAHLVGVTGAPGTGKSTLMTVLTSSYRRAGLTVAVLAVDPTSPFSRGALLGDRVRMTEHSGDPGVFIRSMATRRGMGGLAKTTSDVLLLLDAAGFDRILIETVGVGQTEVKIASTAHTIVVVEAPGMGDEVQALKAGMLEIADIFVVNKADRKGVERTVSALEMIEQTRSEHCGWSIPVLRTVASGAGASGDTRNRGVEQLRNAIEQHRAWLHESGTLTAREKNRFASLLETLVQTELLRRVKHARAAAVGDRLIEQIVRREVDPYRAAADVVNGSGL